PAPYAPGGGWTPDGAHTPSLTYVPYLVTGSHYYLDELQAQASWQLASLWPDGRGNSAGLFDGHAFQVRNQAWGLRDVTDAAFITPDSNPLKSYFVEKVNANLTDYTQKYVVNHFDQGSSQVEGWIYSDYGGGPGLTSPWQQDMMATTFASLQQRGF